MLWIMVYDQGNTWRVSFLLDYCPDEPTIGKFHAIGSGMPSSRSWSKNITWFLYIFNSSPGLHGYFSFFFSTRIAGTDFFFDTGMGIGCVCSGRRRLESVTPKHAPLSNGILSAD
jgi:hypothetical protein